MGEKDRKKDNSGREKEKKIVRETGVGERDAGEKERGRYRGKERERDTGEKQRVRQRQGRKRERERERKREREREREKEREGRKKNIIITNTKNLWNFIFSCSTPQNGVKHDSGL